MKTQIQKGWLLFEVRLFLLPVFHEISVDCWNAVRATLNQFYESKKVSALLDSLVNTDTFLM